MVQLSAQNMSLISVHSDGTMACSYGLVMARGIMDLTSVLARYLSIFACHVVYVIIVCDVGRRKCNRTDVHHLVSSLLAVVEAVHGKEYAWMDIKPSNVVSDGLTLKGIDLGSAIRFADPVVPDGMSLTPRYMCPATASRLLGAVDAPGMARFC